MIFFVMFGAGGGRAPKPQQSQANTVIPFINPGFGNPGPIGPNTTIGQARTDVSAVAPFMPPQIRDLMSMNLGMAEWAAQNPDPMHSPEFMANYTTLFGRPPYRFGSAVGGGMPLGGGFGGSFGGGFGGGLLPSFNQGPIGPNTTIDQARAEVSAVAPFMPPQIRDLMSMNLGMAEWAAENPDPMHSAGFISNYTTLFGRPPYRFQSFG